MIRFPTCISLFFAFSFMVFGFDVEDCPKDCQCSIDGSQMMADCAGLSLSEFPGFSDNEIHFLDISKNDYTQIPPELETFEYLQYLDISENKISRLKPNSLDGLISLQLLNLSKNNISSWLSINPKTLFQPAVSLTEISLSGNPLTSFSTNDDNFLIVSDSLRLLDLSHCKISKVTGHQVLEGMKNLKHLNLASNQIRGVSDLISDSLLTLDLSHNKLTNLMPNMLSNLPALTYINLSRNHRISLRSKQNEFVQSLSLKRIDLSYCNMDDIELDGFPALTTSILKGNMIHELTKDTFANTRMLESLDLSQNSINSIESGAFKKLKHLKVLNLSFNMITKIERETFKENELLIKLDLSRNMINRLNRLNAQNLNFLNLTWCQITIVDPDALSGMAELLQIDLSNNLINDIPDTLYSKSLQKLDLSMNRMTNIRNSTFSGFPEISTINLSGNRFTVPFKKEYFEENFYLAELFLSDNPWLCQNCQEMYAFYSFITEPPAKTWEKQSLKCQSPEDVAGRTWESACYFTWYPQATMGTAEKVWTFFMVTVIAFAGCMCLIMSIKRGIEGRRQTARELERERNMEEGREIIRQNRIRMQQEAQRDAPDPRESRPPCYSEAILMPRLDGSFASLDGLANNKRRRRKTENDDDTDEVPLRRNRCRSEEVLSMREIVRRSTRSPQVVPRIHPIEIEPIDRNNSANENDDDEMSTSIRNLDHSPGPSRARTPKASLRPESESYESIKRFKQLKKTPPPKRQAENIESSFKTKNKSPNATTSNQVDDGSIEIIDDYFDSENNRNSFSESEDSDEFIRINAHESSSSSMNDNGIVILRKPSNI